MSTQKKQRYATGIGVAFLGLALLVTGMLGANASSARPHVAAPYTTEDNFTRANQSLWGTSTNGDGVTNSAWFGDAGRSSSFTLNGNEGVAKCSSCSTGSLFTSFLGATTYDGGDVSAEFMVQSSAQRYAVALNATTDKHNAYMARLNASAGTLQIVKLAANVQTVEASVSATLSVGIWWHIELSDVGGALSAKSWRDGTSEPGWMVTWTDGGSQLAAGDQGIIQQWSTSQASDTSDTIRYWYDAPGVAPTATSVPPTATATQGTTYPVPPTGGATPVGSILPPDSYCAAHITSAAEQRPDNTTANHTVPTQAQINGEDPWGPAIGFTSSSDLLRQRVTGNFTGTTDEIIQWAACKWGLDPDIIRAQAINETNWHENGVGDHTTNSANCPPGGQTDSTGCYESYGFMQIKWMYHTGEWPMAWYDTAYNIDFTYAWLRACYEGDVTYLQGTNGYAAGDMWGCVGFWYSGSWKDSGANSYIASAQSHFNAKPWLQPGF